MNKAVPITCTAYDLWLVCDACTNLPFQVFTAVYRQYAPYAGRRPNFSAVRDPSSAYVLLGQTHDGDGWLSHCQCQLCGYYHVGVVAFALVDVMRAISSTPGLKLMRMTCHAHEGAPKASPIANIEKVLANIDAISSFSYNAHGQGGRDNSHHVRPLPEFGGIESPDGLFSTPPAAAGGSTVFDFMTEFFHMLINNEPYYHKTSTIEPAPDGALNTTVIQRYVNNGNENGFYLALQFLTQCGIISFQAMIGSPTIWPRIDVSCLHIAQLKNADLMAYLTAAGRSLSGLPAPCTYLTPTLVLFS